MKVALRSLTFSGFTVAIVLLVRADSGNRQGTVGSRGSFVVAGLSMQPSELAKSPSPSGPRTCSLPDGMERRRCRRCSVTGACRRWWRSRSSVAEPDLGRQASLGIVLALLSYTGLPLRVFLSSIPHSSCRAGCRGVGGLSVRPRDVLAGVRRRHAGSATRRGGPGSQRAGQTAVFGDGQRARARPVELPSQRAQRLQSSPIARSWDS